MSMLFSESSEFDPSSEAGCKKGYELEVKETNNGQQEISCKKVESETWYKYGKSFLWDDHEQRLAEMKKMADSTINDASDVYKALECVKVILMATWNVLAQSGVSLNNEKHLGRCVQNMLMECSLLAKSLAPCIEVWSLLRTGKSTIEQTNVDMIVMGCWSIRKTVRNLKGRVLSSAADFAQALVDYSKAYHETWSSLVDQRNVEMTEKMSSKRNEYIDELLEWIENTQKVAFDVIMLYLPTVFAYLFPFGSNASSHIGKSISIICALRESYQLFNLIVQQMTQLLDEDSKYRDGILGRLVDKIGNSFQNPCKMSKEYILQTFAISINRFKEEYTACKTGYENETRDAEAAKLLVNYIPSVSYEIVRDPSTIQKALSEANSSVCKKLGIDESETGFSFSIFRKNIAHPFNNVRLDSALSSVDQKLIGEIGSIVLMVCEFSISFAKQKIHDDKTILNLKTISQMTNLYKKYKIPKLSDRYFKKRCAASKSMNLNLLTCEEKFKEYTKQTSLQPPDLKPFDIGDTIDRKVLIESGKQVQKIIRGEKHEDDADKIIETIEVAFSDSGKKAKFSNILTAAALLYRNVREHKQ